MELDLHSGIPKKIEGNQYTGIQAKTYESNKHYTAINDDKSLNDIYLFGPDWFSLPQSCIDLGKFITTSKRISLESPQNQKHEDHRRYD